VTVPATAMRWLGVAGDGMAASRSAHWTIWENESGISLGFGMHLCLPGTR
jgi:hypothetical protein